jgi:hypothetical protein
MKGENAMKKAKLFSITILSIILLVSLAIPALAAPDDPPPMPSNFYGDIHFQSGDDGPIAGDFVDAYVPGLTGYVARAAITTSGSNLVYAINVPSDDPYTTEIIEGGVENAAVTFRIGTRTVAVGTWHSGTNVILNFHPPKAIPNGPYFGNSSTPIPVSGNAEDWGADAVSYHWTNGGSFHIYGPTGNITYDFGGSYTWTLEVTDEQGGVGVASFLVTINQVPVANPQSVTTAEDTAKDITLTGLDSENGVTINYALVTGPSHGALSGTPPNVTYTPAANFNGDDSFTFRVYDEHTAYSAPAMVSITVTPVNDAPVADGQTVTTAEDTPLAITLTGSDVEGSTLTYAIVADPAHGVLSGTPPDVTYTPAANYNGADSFTFKVNDGEADSTAATVSITVTPVNDAPVAVDDADTTAEDTQVVHTDAWVLGNDTDVDNLHSALSVTAVSNPSHCTVAYDGSMNITFTPEANFSGEAGFDYTVSDGELTDVGHMTVTVTPVNDAPVAAGQSLTTPEDTALGITLAANDVESDPLTYSLVAGPSHGALTGTAPNLTYTPASHYYGPDSFTFKANDGQADSNVATISITVTSVNSQPEITEGAAAGVTMSKNGLPLAFALTLHASDADNDTLTWSVLTPASHGAAGVMGTGTTKEINYTPEVDYVGTDSFVVQVSDGEGGTDSITVSVIILNTHSISLVPGWNLVSFNTHPTNTDIADVLASISGKYALVYAWVDGAWRHYAPGVGYGDTLATLDETMGFWIYMDQAATLTVTGTTPTPSGIPLHAGWNLLGFPGASGQALPGGFTDHDVALANINLVMAMHANQTVDPWLLYDPLAPSYVNDLLALEPGWGYWISVDADDTWTVP